MSGAAVSKAKGQLRMLGEWLQVVYLAGASVTAGNM